MYVMDFFHFVHRNLIFSPKSSGCPRCFGAPTWWSILFRVSRVCALRSPRTRGTLINPRVLPRGVGPRFFYCRGVQVLQTKSSLPHRHDNFNTAVVGSRKTSFTRTDRRKLCSNDGKESLLKQHIVSTQMVASVPGKGLGRFCVVPCRHELRRERSTCNYCCFSLSSRGQPTWSNVVLHSADTRVFLAARMPGV